MTSRTIDSSIEAALEDLFRQRAIVEDGIEKLQALLESLQERSPQHRLRSASRAPKKASRRSASARGN